MLQENYSTKLILSGNRLEIVNYEKEIVRNRPSKGGRKYSYLEPSDQITENRKTSSNRAILNFKRLVHCNFSIECCFLTLTFGNFEPKIVDSIESYKIAFNKFMKKLRKQHQHIKHLAVIVNVNISVYNIARLSMYKINDLLSLNNPSNGKIHPQL